MIISKIVKRQLSIFKNSFKNIFDESKSLKFLRNSLLSPLKFVSLNFVSFPQFCFAVSELWKLNQNEWGQYFNLLKYSASTVFFYFSGALIYLVPKNYQYKDRWDHFKIKYFSTTCVSKFYMTSKFTRIANV